MKPRIMVETPVVEDQLQSLILMTKKEKPPQKALLDL